MNLLGERFTLVDENGNPIPPCFYKKREVREIKCKKCGGIFLGGSGSSVCFDCQRETDRTRQRGKYRAKYKKKYHERNKVGYWKTKNK